jgi:ankyrin repeat protein
MHAHQSMYSIVYLHSWHLLLFRLTRNKTDYNDTPLHLAAYHGHAAVVRPLLERGADLTVVNEDKYTSLHLAAEQGHDGVVQLLLDRGADLTAVNRERSTPLDLAVYNGHEGVVQLLLERGADLTAINEYNDTPRVLHLAARRAHGPVVEPLLQHGADASARNRSYQTAWEMARDNGLTNVMQGIERERPGYVFV